MKSVKLRNTSTCFIDPETGFSISGADVVALPSRLGARTRERIQAGGLIVIEEEAPPVVIEKLVEPEPVADNIDSDVGEAFSEEDAEAWRFYDKEEVDAMHYFDLYRLALAFGMTFGRSKPKLAQLRDDFMAQQEKLKANL
jgi:hypothetical protein